MSPLFLRILDGYLGRTKRKITQDAEYYNHLPMIFRVKDYNNLDLSQDYKARSIILPARANARNIHLAERMRRYATYRVTK